VSKRKKAEGEERSPSSLGPTTSEKRDFGVILETPGFYIVDREGNVRCREVTKGKPGSPDRRTVEEPVRYRTIATAMEICELLGDGFAILRTVFENFAWGE
jgi:hypothetical protein